MLSYVIKYKKIKLQCFASHHFPHRIVCERERERKKDRERERERGRERESERERD